MSANPILHSKAKPIELDFYFACEKVLTKKLTIQHVPIIDQIVDMLIKPITTTPFVGLRYKLSVKKPTMSLKREYWR